jgi:hypothetical protein
MLEAALFDMLNLAFPPFVMRELDPLRGRSRFGAAKARASILKPSFRGARLRANPESRTVHGAGFRVCA